MRRRTCTTVRRRLTSSRVHPRPRRMPLQKVTELATGCEEDAASTTHYGAVRVLGIDNGRRVAIGAGRFLRHSISPSSRTAITANGDDGSARGRGRGACAASASSSRESRRPRPRASTGAGALSGAELPPRKDVDQFFWKMATDGFQVFGRRAGQQNAGPFANFSEALVFVEKFENDFGVERGTKLIDHIQIPQVPKYLPHVACAPASPKVIGVRLDRTSPHGDASATRGRRTAPKRGGRRVRGGLPRGVGFRERVNRPVGLRY
jgi:hypothetical protein